MSLFPAYAEQAASASENAEKQQGTWLQNSSYQIKIDLPNPTNTNANKESSTDEEAPVEKVKPKKRKHEKAEEEKQFYVDKSKTREFLLASVKTISRPSVSRYKIKYYFNKNRSHKIRKIKRYFKVCLKNETESGEADTVITQKTLDLTPVAQERDTNYTGFKQESELSQKTAEFNKLLANEPGNIKVWLEYIKFQDDVYTFEKTYKKGSIAKGLRANADKKISILEKALSLNPNCEELARERINILVAVYPADELQQILKTLVEKDQSDIILWQGYIESVQCSMSHCNTRSVMELYSKCLSVLHKIRQSATVDKATLEENILRMFYQCTLFLKQTGLVEQLWTLLRMYLELNLTPNPLNLFNIGSNFKEKQLLELEDVVFKSKLPIHELWLRTEKLRESCHWIPFIGESCEDPQRLVFTEDVAELIHPITIPGNIFKLNVIILSLLKVPLLPTRHCTISKLGLDFVPWAFDSLETFFPALDNTYPINLNNKNFLNDNRLYTGPQYVKVLPGQEEYLEFVLKTMKNCIDCLKDADKLAVTIWWMRFQKLLIILQKQNRLKLPQNYNKKIKSNVKNVLKADENRTNVTLYCEYALIENELTSFEACVNILKTVKAKNVKIAVNNITNLEIEQCYLVKTLVHQILQQSTPQSGSDALKILILFALGKEGTTNEASLAFKHITLQLIEKPLENLEPNKHFLPDFFTNWIICHGWFIYLSEDPIQCGKFIENVLESMEEHSTEKSFQKEVLHEFYVAAIFKYCTENIGSGIFKILDNILHRSIELYPNNIFFLSVLAKEQSIINTIGHNWWKLKNLLLKTDRAIPILFLVHIFNQQMAETKEVILDTITGQHLEVNSSFKNRMLALFKLITKPNICTRRCGLVWRLFLQFVYINFDSKLCRNVYYSAVEECPWLKALYIDAAIYIPGELSQIQDLIIEKEFRLHVTPEELDVLRD